MENTVIALVSVLIGVVATFVASRHYYRRSVEKELTPFIQMQTNVLSHIDEEVKSDLHVEYKGVKVDSLQQVQFLVANTGERAIRDLIKPLCLHLPNDVEVMDASVLYISPEGREVALSVSETEDTISFDFPLLNKDEFFIFKLLLRGAPKREQFKFSIVGDDLPPELKVRRLTYKQIEKDENIEHKKSFELGAFFAGMFIVLVAFCLGLLAHYTSVESFPAIQSEYWTWINSIPFVSIASLVGYVLAGIFGLAGTMIMAASIFGDFEFPRNKKFKLPKEFSEADYGFRNIDEMIWIQEQTANKSIQPTANAAAD